MMWGSKKYSLARRILNKVTTLIVPPPSPLRAPPRHVLRRAARLWRIPQHIDDVPSKTAGALLAADGTRVAVVVGFEALRRQR